MIDTHCHLLHKGLSERFEEVIIDAKNSMKAIINCGYPKDAEASLELCQKHRGFVYITLGLHPIDVVKMSIPDIEEYIEFVKFHKKDILAIGEIGLDEHWFPEKEKQPYLENAFQKMIDLAKELKLPVVLHTRKAEQKCFDIAVKNELKDVVFHCYAGNLTLAKNIVDKGYYISLGTNLLRSKNTKKIAQKYPLEQLLTETDAPFLSPYPNQENVPQNVKFVLEEISKLREIRFDEVEKIIDNNCKRLFKI